MFFIVGTGRSGTQTIAKTLTSLPGCTCLHEPSPQMILESSGYRYGTVGLAEVSRTLEETRQPFVDGSVYCESNQTLALLIPVVAEVFPDARYVWLIRSALDVVASAYQKQWYTGHSENHNRYEDCPPLEQAWIDGRIRGDLCGDMSAAKWASLDRFGKCCWYWCYVNRVIEQDLGQYAADRFLFLRLEEIDGEMKHLVEWMGFDPSIVPPVGRHNIAKRVPYHWTEWSADQWATFEHWSGDLMDRFYPSWRTYTGGDSELYIAPAIRGLRQQAQLALEQAEHQTARVEHLTSENRRLTAENGRLALRLSRIENSLFWKMTAPFRKLAAALRGPRRQ